MKFCIYILIFFFFLVFSTCRADDIQNPSNQTEIQKERVCDKCSIDDDDEYCVYNQCFLDRQYRKMKLALCLEPNQEVSIDTIYKNFKTDLENLCSSYKTEKNKLLELIECNKGCCDCEIKKQMKIVKNIKKEIKERMSDFKEDVQEKLCKKQQREYKKFLHCEKSKIKKMIKFGAIYKLPCVDCPDN